MRCEEFKGKVDAYIEGELSTDESTEFESHLCSCQNCRMEMESIKKSINMMRNVFSDKKPPSGIKKKVFDKACSPPEDES